MSGRSWILVALLTAALLISACGSEEPPDTPVPTPAATTSAETPAATPVQTPAPTRDIESVVRRVLAEQRGAETPTPTPAPAPTIDVEAITFDVMQRVLATLEERQTPTPEPTPEPTPTPTPTPMPTPTPSLPAVIRDAQKSLVRITGLGDETATGVVVDVDASTGDIYVLTRRQPVMEAKTLQSTIGASQEYEATIMDSDDVRDVALLRLCCDASVAVMPFGDALTLEVGSEVVALEYASGTGSGLIVSGGIVSSVIFDGERERWIIVTDARISGVGGGALITPDGRLVGLLIEGTDSGFGRAVSEITLSELLPALR